MKKNINFINVFFYHLPLISEDMNEQEVINNGLKKGYTSFLQTNDGKIVIDKSKPKQKIDIMKVMKSENFNELFQLINDQK